MPKVVRLVTCNYHKERATKPSKRNIFLRDHGECQYCGVTLKRCDATIDHVKPKSKGGRGTWDNLVLACKYCNQKKGCAWAHQVGLTLRKQPKKPSNRQLLRAKIPDDWDAWL